MKRVHDIKIDKEWADAVLNHEKTFELRFNDRGYQTGDYIRFHVVELKEEEYNLTPIEHRLNNKIWQITYILSGNGLKNGYVALAIKEMDGR